MSEDQLSVKEFSGVVKAALVDKKITVDEAFGMVVAAVELAEKFIGRENRKQFVITALNEVVDENVKDDNVKKFIKMTIPGTIEVVIGISKGKYNINKVTSKFWCCGKK